MFWDLLLCFVIGFRCSRGLSSLQVSYLAVIGHIVYLVLFMRCKNFQMKSSVLPRVLQALKVLVSFVS